MRRRLLDATVATLSEKGYGATTTLEVQRRAGVSRGALLHQFASRSELILAAVDYLSAQRATEVILIARASAPGSGRIEWAVRVLWSTFEGPLFTASLELWMAARYDPELLAALLPHERILGQTIRGVATELFGQQFASQAGFDDAFELLADAMRGAAARAVLRSAVGDERLVKQWVRLIRDRLEAQDQQPAG